MKWFWTRFTPEYPRTILYMLQASEYRIGDYLRWLHRTNDFRQVMVRRRLDLTYKIKLLAAAIIFVTVIYDVIGLILVYSGTSVEALFGFVLIILTPWLISYIVILPLWVGQVFVQKPQEKRIVLHAHQKLAEHKATKIAIAGSFGKTTAKEVLKTVLSEHKKVAATPGNMNTPIGTSRFIESLDGDEEIIIFEMGESHVGDIQELCELVRPDMGIVTGINEAHLETFGTIQNTIATIFELRDYLGDRPLYKNKESHYVRETIELDDPLAYDRAGVDGWQVTDVKSDIHGTEFSIQKDAKVVWAKTGVLGEHHLGILSAAVSIADRFGLSTSQIASGLKNVVPFEHRMQPYELRGAWIIDDTYNGNIEGVKAGLELLKSFDATRRVYVTPGLVEQGSRTQDIHYEIGRLIAPVADVAVLMNNSVTKYITDGLDAAGFEGKIQIIDEPLAFYSNLDQFVAHGDVVLMQNDWTDNYK